MELGPQAMLVAVSHPSQDKLRALLDGHQADYFDSYVDAARALGERSYAAAVVGLHFGESRMFDFVSEVKRRQPEARVICVQGTAGHLGEGVLAGLRGSLELLGAEGVIDLSRLSTADCRTLAQLLRLPAAA